MSGGRGRAGGPPAVVEVGGGGPGSSGDHLEGGRGRVREGACEGGGRLGSKSIITEMK